MDWKDFDKNMEEAQKKHAKFEVFFWIVFSFALILSVGFLLTVSYVAFHFLQKVW